MKPYIDSTLLFGYISHVDFKFQGRNIWMKIGEIEANSQRIYITSNMDSEGLLTTLFMSKDTMGFANSSDIY